MGIRIGFFCFHFFFFLMRGLIIDCGLPGQGNLPNSGIEPACLMSPALAGMFSTTSANLGSPVRSQSGLWEFVQITQWVAAGFFYAVDQPEPAAGEKWWLRMIGWGFISCVLRGNLTCNQFHQDIPLGIGRQLPSRIAKKREFRGRLRTNLVLGSADKCRWKDQEWTVTLSSWSN